MSSGSGLKSNTPGVVAMTKRALGVLLVLGLFPQCSFSMDYLAKKKVVAAAAAPVRTGSTVTANQGNANTGSASLAIPADTTFLLCHWNFYSGTANVLSGAQSLTIGGQAMTIVSGGDSSNAAFMGILAYRNAPLTGTQTLAWDWAGTTVVNDGASRYCTFYKQVNSSTPVRSSVCAQAGTPPYSTGSLTA